MQLNNSLYRFPKNAKTFLVFFLISLSIGYFSGFKFLRITTKLTPAGIEKNYNGNENADSEADFFYKKSEREILTSIHNHILSLSVIFLLVGSLVLLTNLPPIIKGFLTIEPMISIVVTFGGIWLMWKGILWMKYIVMISGILLTLSFVTAIALLLWHLLFVKSDTNS